VRKKLGELFDIHGKNLVPVKLLRNLNSHKIKNNLT